MAATKRLAVGAGAALAIAGALIGKWEGGTRFVPFRDQGGVLTVCDGHTGKDVIEGREYTKAECDAFLARDMAEANAAVKRCLPMPLLPQIEGALTSAVYNAGPKVVCGSTLQTMALANRWPQACAELSRWKYVNREVSHGLENRRDDERAICEGRILWR